MGPQLALASPKSQFGIEHMASQASARLAVWVYGMRPIAMAAFNRQFLSKALAQFSRPALNATRPAAGIASHAALPQRTARVHNSPLQLTLADQWTKITSILVQSVEGASAIKDMQSAATQQLDLAQYGLSTLVDELSAVMAMPGVTSGRRPNSAIVHAFGGNISSAETAVRANRSRALAA